MQRHGPRWKGLRAQLLVFTAKHGERAALARELDVSRQTLNVWLSGEAMPSAEYTLRLLEWVAEVEEKKRPGRVNARPTRKTRVKPKNENQKSSDRKKK